jgi:hypothetical protein
MTTQAENFLSLITATTYEEQKKKEMKLNWGRCFFTEETFLEG